jgi:MFS family permease
MYSESDLAGAVEAGAISHEAAAALRNHVAAGRSTPAVDEESFRLLTGFNDIFVGIASILILVAVGWIGFYIGSKIVGLDNAHEGPRQIGVAVAFGGFAVSITSWLLAEYFTRQRRMALPSILLLLGFAGGFFVGFGAIWGANAPWLSEQLGLTTELQHRQLAGVIGVVTGIVTAGVAFLHWRRFMVPITVAVGALALVAVAVGAITAFVPASQDALNPMVLIAGVLVFAFAMRWDISDRERRTRRSDVAFWLHLAAAPLIAHPVFHMLGVFDGDIGAPMAGVVLGLYIVFAVVALAVDRRALLVSSLVYVLWAMYALFEQSGAVELAAALTALVIGSALLTLSAFWQPMRRQVVGLLGKDIEGRLPPTQLALA